jgi:hypothetical protein
LGDTAVRITPTKVLLTLAVIVSRSVVAAEPTARAETVAEFAVRQLTEFPSGTVAKCAREVPSLKRDLDRALAERRSRIVNLAKGLLTEARFLSATRDSISPGVVSFYKFMEGERVPIHLGPDAKGYCDGILKELRGSDDKLLASQLEETIAKVQENMVVFKKEIL